MVACLKELFLETELMLLPLNSNYSFASMIITFFWDLDFCMVALEDFLTRMGLSSLGFTWYSLRRRKGQNFSISL